MTVSVTEAKNKFLELLVIVEEGETVTIERHGKPLAEITKTVTKRKPQFETMNGKIKVVDPNWDAPQNDVEVWLQGDV